MNQEWLGLIIPLYCLLFLLAYLDLAAIYDTDENTGPNTYKDFMGFLNSHGWRIKPEVMVLALPAILVGYTAGYFQRQTNSKF